MDLTTKVFDQLRKELENGDYPEGSRFPSEIILADRFSVNRVTINKAVARLVQAGYLARGIRGAGTRVISSTVFPRGYIAYVGGSSIYALRILAGIQQEALCAGYVAIVIAPPLEEISNFVRQLSKANICGIITAQCGFISPPTDLPLIYVDYNQAISLPGSRTVNSDNYTGGVQLMREILNRGHREIAVYATEHRAFSNQNKYAARVKGFCEAMNEFGIENADERIFAGTPNSISDAKRILTKIYNQIPNCSIIATDSDLNANALRLAAAQMSMPLPTLTGFGNISDYPMASVEQHPEDLGAYACRYLLEIIENRRDPTAPLHEFFAAQPVKLEYIPQR